MKNKKIFFIADAKSIHTVKWIDYFVEKKYDVYLATFADVNNTMCKKVYFLSEQKRDTNGGNYHYLFAVGKLADIFKEVIPDVINAHYSYSMGLIALLAKIKAKVNSSFSVVCHGSDILDPPLPCIFDFVNRSILKKCDKIFVVSDQIKDKIETFGIDADKIYVGQYGVDINISNSVTKDIDILSNRAFNKNSRIDFLLDVIDSLNIKDLNIVFVLPNILENDFRKLSEKYKYINFYKKVDYKTMMNLMSRTKIYISATKSDGTALSLLEAMNFRLIPVVSNIVSNRSWIVDSVNGYLFNNKSECIQKLKKVLAEDNQTIKDINSKLVRDKADYTNQMIEIEKLLVK